jgi:hypothetical protein
MIISLDVKALGSMPLHFDTDGLKFDGRAI